MEAMKQQLGAKAPQNVDEVTQWILLFYCWPFCHCERLPLTIYITIVFVSSAYLRWFPQSEMWFEFYDKHFPGLKKTFYFKLRHIAIVSVLTGGCLPGVSWNPVKAFLLSPWVNHSTLIAQYWLDSETGLSWIYMSRFG